MKKASLWIGLGALVVLCAAYMGVSAWTEASTKKTEAAEEAAKIYMTDLKDTSGITEISYKNSSEELAFEKEDDTWYYKEDHAFPVKQSELTDLAEQAGQLEATRKLEDGDSLSQYGLDAPTYSLSFMTAEGAQKQILIGDQAEGGDYYATLDGESTAYTIGSTLPASLDRGLYDFIQLEEFPQIEGTNIQQMTITKDGDTYHYEKKTVDDEGNIAWYDGSSADEENKMEDNGRGNTLADAISDLYVQSCVDYKAGAEDLSQYGLDQPNAVIWYTYEENGQTNTLKLDIGSLDKDSTYYYTRREGSDAVNQIAKSTVDKCLNVGEETE